MKPLVTFFPKRQTLQIISLGKREAPILRSVLFLTLRLGLLG